MGAVRWMEGNHAKERAGTNGNVRILLSLYIPYWMLSLLLLVYQLWKWSTKQCTNYVNRCKNSLSLYIACYEEFRNMLVIYVMIIPFRELGFQLSFFALLLAILFLRNTNVRLSFFHVYVLRKNNTWLRKYWNKLTAICNWSMRWFTILWFHLDHT